MHHDAAATSTDAVRSLLWSAEIEHMTSSLPRRRGLRWWRERNFFYDNRVAVVASLDTNTAFPARGVFVDPRTGMSMLIRPNRPQVRSQAAADVIVAGLMRTSTQLRFRSFYVSGENPRSLAAHQRSSPESPTPLVEGVRFQQEVRGRIPFVVPRVLEAGHASDADLHVGAGPAVVDWVVEEALDGSVVPTEAAEDTAREVLGLFAESWHTLGVHHAPMDPDQQRRASTAFADFVKNAAPDLWPADVDRHLTLRHAQKLLESRQPLTIGFTHGDPGIPNILRLSDRRLALIDWEHAGDRLVAHDVLKVTMSTPDPPTFATTLHAPAELRPTLSAAGTLPWRSQVAVALLLFIRPWRYRHARAIKRGSEVAHVRRMHALLRTLTTLMES